MTTIALCDPVRCAAAGCTATVCIGAGRSVQRRAVRPFEAGHPRRRELVDPGLQGGRRRAVRRRPRVGRDDHRRRGHHLLRPGAELRGDHPRPCPPGGHRRAAPRRRRRHVVRRADATGDEARRSDQRAGAELRAGPPDELGHRGDEHRRPTGPWRDRPRPHRHVRRQLPRRHRRAARRRRQRRRHARPAGHGRRAAGGRGRDDGRAVQRRARTRRPGRRRHRRADRGQHGRGRARRPGSSPVSAPSATASARC